MDKTGETQRDDQPGTRFTDLVTDLVTDLDFICTNLGYNGSLTKYITV